MAVFECEPCNISRVVSDDFIGRRVRCPECGQEQVIQAEKDNSFDPGPENARFSCQECGHSREVSVSLVGRKAKCPKCEAVGRVVEDVTEDDVDLTDLVEPVTDDYLLGQEVSPAELPISDKSEPRLFRGGVLGNILVGLASGGLTYLFCIALSVFVNPLGWETGYFSVFLTSALISAVVFCLVLPIGSGVRFALGGPETGMAAVVALMSGAIMSGMQGLPKGEIMTTVMAATSIMGVVVGLAAIIASVVRGGSWLRFIPIEIMGGVMGGVGVMLIQAAYTFMTGQPLTLQTIIQSVSLDAVQDSLGTGALWSWLPAMIVGWFMFAALRKRRNTYLFLAVLIVLCGIGHVLVSQKVPMAADILSSSPVLHHFFDPLKTLGHFSQGAMNFVHWPAIFGAFPYMASAVILLAALGLYRTIILENYNGGETDLDRELMVNGTANLVSGLVGGLPGMIGSGRSLGAYFAGARGGLSGIVAGLVCAVALFYGWLVLPWIPSVVPASLLVFFGLGLIRTWMFASRDDFVRRDDKMLVWLTFAITVFIGLPIGTASGMILALAVTVSRYGRAGGVKHVLSGANHRSNVDRAPIQVKVLRERGGAILILQLHGFISNGALHEARKVISKRITDIVRTDIESVVIDFTSVRGFGSNLGRGFDKLYALGIEHELNIVFIKIPLELEELFARRGYAVGDMAGSFKFFMDLDYALEWCEDRILESEGALSVKQLSLRDLLAPVFPDYHRIDDLLEVLDRLEIKKGRYIFKQGDKSEALYFVESGKLIVELSMDDGHNVRLKKVGSGAVVGEMGLYTATPRSASVVAAEKSVIYRLPGSRLEELRSGSPDLYARINKFLVNLLAERVRDSNAMVRDLLR